MNEVKKWLRNWTEKSGKAPSEATATLLFLEPIKSATSRTSDIKILPALLREYESEYHYLFHQVLKYSENPSAAAGWSYLLPNAMRKVLEIFLAFKIPGSDGLRGKVESIIKQANQTDGDRIRAVERLVHLESHADNLDDLVGFSSMSIEEIETSAAALLSLIKLMDEMHFKQMSSICKNA